MKDMDDAALELKTRKGALGGCVVKIGGKAIKRRTHAIIIPDQPTLQEQRAAQGLRYHLELITGQAVAIRHEKNAKGSIPVIVGNCPLIAELGAGLDFQSLGIEGIHIKTVGPALMLAGNKRGVLYATYTFLEDYLGCRWAHQPAQLTGKYFFRR